MLDRPYTLLSCALSIDGYLDAEVDAFLIRSAKPGASRFSMFFLISLYAGSLGYSAIHDVLSYLPLAVTIILAAGVASQLVTRVGFKPILAVTHGRSPAVAHRRS